MAPTGTAGAMATAVKRAMPARPLKTAAPFRKLGFPPARAGHHSFPEVSP
jgi:hypothetical protein